MAFRLHIQHAIKLFCLFAYLAAAQEARNVI